MLAALTGAVGYRLGTGQPFETIGQWLNNSLVGDLDDEARARMAVRQRLSADANLMRIVGRENAVNSQIRKIGDDLYKIEKQRQDGRTLIREAFPVDGTFGTAILALDKRVRDAFRRVENSPELDGSVQKLRAVHPRGGR